MLQGCPRAIMRTRSVRFFTATCFSITSGVRRAPANHRSGARQRWGAAFATRHMLQLWSPLATSASGPGTPFPSFDRPLVKSRACRRPSSQTTEGRTV
ncbi:hypothetical protein Micbo1qcDRAFT_159947 [Microdochium bolleyi]|uniref:Uncharacterized protein n=1 Tax=Microdochium bolleyi TaxID=196109 RepID=A0A136JC15_9PEZI|nr:hypothetical protein Micbo1qcDRAFT_159947 [Microdochium bolleyi]